MDSLTKKYRIHTEIGKGQNAEYQFEFGYRIVSDFVNGVETARCVCDKVNYGIGE